MKILIADDEAVSRRLLQSHLSRWGYDVVAVSNGAEAWEILQPQDAPRLAVLDWMMPGMDGVSICREARKRVARPYVYLLLLTARNEKVDVIEGLDAGADDYLTKPFDPQELSARLRVGKRILELEDNLLAARTDLEFRATHDPLTGLYNRAVIMDLLQRELTRARRLAAPVSVLLLDLDHFKSINDTYGHLAGDEVLRQTARWLTTGVREYDGVGRYGGEEFLLVLPGCSAEVAVGRAEDVRLAIATHPVEATEGCIRVTLSIGAATTNLGHETGAEPLLRAADAALYRAKQAGRNRVEVAPLVEPAPSHLPTPAPSSSLSEGE